MVQDELEFVQFLTKLEKVQIPVGNVDFAG